MKLNLGAIKIFGTRYIQYNSYLMIAAMFFKINDIVQVRVAIPLLAALILIVDIWKIFPQEQEYSVKRNKFLLDKIQKGNHE